MGSQDEFLQTLEEWSKLYFFQTITEFFNYLKNSDLSILQAYALTHLFFKGRMKVSDLQEHLLVSPGAASQLVDRLEKLGMVERVEDPNDRRVRNVIVSAKGKHFVQEQFVMSQHWLTEIPADVSPEQMEQIATILAMLIQKTDQ